MNDHEANVAELTRLLATAPPPPDLTPAVVDQLIAASREARTLVDHYGTAAASLDPDRWATARTKESDDADAAREVTARVLLALGGSRFCPHLRDGPRPATARLSLHRVDCRRCCTTVRRPPTDEADRCDWCGVRGVETFRPVVLHLGPLVAIGDACEPCGTALCSAAGVST